MLKHLAVQIDFKLIRYVKLTQGPHSKCHKLAKACNFTKQRWCSMSTTEERMRAKSCWWTQERNASALSNFSRPQKVHRVV